VNKMAQIKLLKIGSLGIPTEFDSATDEITLASFSVDGGGPVLSSGGLDMNDTDVSDVKDLLFTDPSTAVINQTAGNLIVDDLMAKDRENVMTTAGSVTFPVVTDVAAEVDAFRLPALAGAPTAAPANGGEGHMVWDSTNNVLYVWDGAGWDNQNVVDEANRINNQYIAEVAVDARDVVYVSSADSVSPAQANTEAHVAGLVGFAKADAAAAANVEVISSGVLAGFSGLTPGARYYLSAATAGEITATIPTGTGNIITLVGVAKSATELNIRIQDLGRRAV
jgi:hypothetical protein